MKGLLGLKMGTCSLLASVALLALPAAAGAGKRAPSLSRDGVARIPVGAISTHVVSGTGVPSPSNDSVLTGISCTSASDCWAVGWYFNSAEAQLNQALRWNGKKWEQVTTPDPAGDSTSNDINVLSGVTCVTASDCWAVGKYSNGSGTALNEILRWNGKKWKRVNVPDPGRSSPGGTNVVLGVSCPSASDCWAVGWYTKHNGGFLNETLRWNGSKWSLAEAPHPAGTAPGDLNQLEAVTCTSESSCWAVGNVVSPVVNENEALHFNGKSWRRVATPQLPEDGNKPDSTDALYSIACPSAADCWADGESNNGSDNPALGMVLRWNGSKWETVSTPEPGSSSDSDAVACTSASDCWAVGDYTKSTGATLNEVLRWHAKIWTEVSAPDAGGRASTDFNNLFWDACVSSSDCWAVGYVVNASGDTLDQALHFNGKKWSSR